MGKEINMPKKLYLDIETYSSVDLARSGVYKYAASEDFRIIMVAYGFDNGPVEVLDTKGCHTMLGSLLKVMRDPSIIKVAHNATFERICFRAAGIDIPAEQWECTMVKAAYCGLPLSLDALSSALELGEHGKKSTGKALIRYFCMPCKPTKVNGGRTQNLPEHDPDKWDEFKRYCEYDVVAERNIDRILDKYELPDLEKTNYLVDQKINDRGIRVDLRLADMAVKFADANTTELTKEVYELTGLDNPNSPAQLKKWIGDALGREIKTLAKDSIPALLEEAGDRAVSEVIKIRQKMSKTSVKKYQAMQACAMDSGRAHGLFQFYGANRTGRWAGRIVQLQNLPRNYMDDLELARDFIKTGDYDLFQLLYEDTSQVLSELIRTAFIPREGRVFAVADYSAIEARVIAWLADEKWRLKVFQGHGKIYEASAAMMFNVPIEQVTKGSDLRSKGKIAELALGYQGSVGAMDKMGAASMGLSEIEMKEIVRKWREANPKIVNLWYSIENTAIRAIKTKKKIKMGVLSFEYDGDCLMIELPSGRKLFYQKPYLALNKFDREAIKYWGMDQTTKKWTVLDTYGGKLVENITQAIARDLLADTMKKLDDKGIPVCMHVHDEVVCEIQDISLDSLQRKRFYGDKKEMMDIICQLMSVPPSWAKTLPLAAEGYLTKFYKKD